jgi:hypothetical protein
VALLKPHLPGMTALRDVTGRFVRPRIAAGTGRAPRQHIVENALAWAAVHVPRRRTRMLAG